MKLKLDNRCKHFNGTVNQTCNAGVAYESVRTSDPFPNNLPCMPNGGTIPCAKREYATAEEMRAEEEMIMGHLRDTTTARQAIVAFTGGKRGVSGVIDCPICKTGKIRFDVAGRNGHIWAKCSTDKCVYWIE